MSTRPNDLAPAQARQPIVCIADADPGVRDGVRALLGTLGADVRTYSTGADLLAEVADDQPACVIADLQLPDMSGLELLEALRERHCTAPAILLSTEADVSSAVAAMRGGALDFIEKPYIDRALLTQVAPLLRRPPRELRQRAR